MSFNRAITGAAFRLSQGLFATAFIDHETNPHEAANANVSAFTEDDPWCGTKVPGFHPPRPHVVETSLNNSVLDKVAVNPQPLPPRDQWAGAQLHDVRLLQKDAFDNSMPILVRESTTFSAVVARDHDQDDYPPNAMTLPGRFLLTGLGAIGARIQRHSCGGDVLGGNEGTTPALNKSTDVTLKRGVTGSLNFYPWLDDIRNGNKNALRNVTVQLQNENTPRSRRPGN